MRVEKKTRGWRQNPKGHRNKAQGQFQKKEACMEEGRKNKHKIEKEDHSCQASKHLEKCLLQQLYRLIHVANSKVYMQAGSDFGK